MYKHIVPWTSEVKEEADREPKEEEEESKVKEEESEIKEEVVMEELKQPELKNRLALSMCPGKNMSQGRDGRTYVRDIA